MRVPALALALTLAVVILPAAPAFATTMTVSAANATYTGSPVRPALVVAVDGRQLVHESEYATSWRNNVNAGTGRVSVSGKGRYAGLRASATFKIARADAAKASAKGLAASYPYTGTAVKPELAVALGAKELVEGRDYTVGYAANVNAGTAKVTITGKRNLSGTKMLTFKISRAPISKVDAAKMPARYADGFTKVKPDPALSYNGKALKRGADYTVSWSSNKEPGTGKAKVTGKGNFTGTRTVKFTLVNMGDGLARAACKLSYSRQTRQKGGKYAGTPAYRKAYRKFGLNKGTNGLACDAAVGTIVRWSGYDKRCPGGLASMISYFPKSAKWKKVASFKKGKVDTSRLLPGDVLFSHPHVLIYVGKGIAKEVYKSDLEGTKADLGSIQGKWVSAHYGGGKASLKAAPCIAKAGWASVNNYAYTAYRCVKPSDSSLRAGKKA